jgi:tetratricopeptide (TPR) repeat protein
VERAEIVALEAAYARHSEGRPGHETALRIAGAWLRQREVTSAQLWLDRAKIWPDLTGDRAARANMLQLQAGIYAETGKRLEALATSQAATALFRQLAGENPAAFTPNLAQSLSVLGDQLGQLGRHAEAAGALGEAMRRLRPYWEALPQAHGELLAAIVSDYLAACAQAGQAPEAAGGHLARQLGLTPPEGAAGVG